MAPGRVQGDGHRAGPAGAAAAPPSAHGQQRSCGGDSAASGPAPLRAGEGSSRLGAAAPALPPLTALRAAEKRPPPPRTAVTRNHSCWRPEALPLLLSQDGGGYRDRAAVFRHVQAPERGGNAAGASGTAAPLFFPLLPAPCCPRRGLPGRRRLGGAERRWAGEAG